MTLDRIRRWGLALTFAGATSLMAAIPAAPGVVNFVEGQATLDGRAISSSAVGSAQMQAGDVLETTNGRAEVLLSPGVFLRVGQNSAIRMVSPDLINTQLAVERGTALVEADQLHKESNIRILDNGSQTTFEKNGLYRFSAENTTPSVAVYDGKAQVQESDRTVELKSGHEVLLNGPAKTQKFDKKQTENNDQLYAWSKMRSEYMSEASAATSRTYIVNGGWWGPGWYWNPMWRTYAWLPGDSLFYSPFGFGYYSPFYFGYYGGPAYYRVRPAYRSGAVVAGPRVIRPQGGISGFRAPVMRSAPMSGGFHAMGGGVRGGMGGGRR